MYLLNLLTVTNLLFLYPVFDQTPIISPLKRQVSQKASYRTQQILR